MNIPPSTTCPTCGLTSYNPGDIANRFCVACGFYDDMERLRAVAVLAGFYSRCRPRHPVLFLVDEARDFAIAVAFDFLGRCRISR